MSQSNEQQTPTNGLYPGEIRLFPFRHEELPHGWYFCNGERFAFTSPQGDVLCGLSENFRADWGLEKDECSISLPNLFSQDGRGCFLRPVDGLTRQVGAEQGDAIRNITGEVERIRQNTAPCGSSIALAGAFVRGPHHASQTYLVGNAKSSNVSEIASLLFDASQVVPTAPENRPLNLGMTPAIYLGV